jgi:hypothetical protein
MKYQVDICIKASPYPDEPDGATYKSYHFDDLDKARNFAADNIHKDIYREVHLHYYTEDEYGKEFYPEKMETFSELYL